MLPLLLNIYKYKYICDSTSISCMNLFFQGCHQRTGGDRTGVRKGPGSSGPQLLNPHGIRESSESHQEQFRSHIRKPEGNRGISQDVSEISFGHKKYFNFDVIFRVLMEGVKYYAKEPLLLGKTFLRLERDFDKHVHYCRDEPLAQEFLDTCDEAYDYFAVSTRVDSSF